MPSKVWEEIAYPFRNFNGCTVEVKEWISNFIPPFYKDSGLKTQDSGMIYST